MGSKDDMESQVATSDRSDKQKWEGGLCPPTLRKKRSWNGWKRVHLSTIMFLQPGRGQKWRPTLWLPKQIWCTAHPACWTSGQPASKITTQSQWERSVLIHPVVVPEVAVDHHQGRIHDVLHKVSTFNAIKNPGDGQFIRWSRQWEWRKSKRSQKCLPGWH